MKKNLALILALVMLLGTLFSLAPMAEEAGTTPPAAETPAVRYTPEIAYSNLNYSDKMYMMFAVPAPAALDEGAAVKLILWESFDEIEHFSFNDQNKIVIEAEDATVKIGEVDHLVFKYDALTAADMGKVIYTRPVVVAADKATAYGPVVEYSVLEYVTAAKGGFEGIAGLTDKAVVDMLDSMLDFGALAQKYLSEDEAPFYPNDELNKIFVNPVINGKAAGKEFAGFFKYVEGGKINLVLPYYDYYEAVSILDKNGAVVVDADERESGFQIAVTEADIELTVEYKSRTFFDADVSVNTQNASLNSSDNTPGKAYGYYDSGIGGFSFNTSGGYTWKNYCYNSLDVVDDPYNEGEKTFKWVCTNTSAIQLGDSKNDYNNAYRLSTNAYFGDTVAPVITIELVLGGTANSADINLGNFRIRGTGSSDLLIPFKITGGKVYVYTANDKNASTPLSVPIPKDGYAKYAIVIDFENEVISAYVEGEDGKMIKEVECTTPYCAGTQVTDMGWLKWAKTNHQKWEWHGGSNGITEEEKALIGDAAAPNLDLLAETVSAKNYVLIKDLNIVFGNSAEQ